MRQTRRYFFSAPDRRRLAAAMQRTSCVRHFRRLQAVSLVAEGVSAGRAATLLKASRRWVCKCIASYCRHRRPEDLAEGEHSGRPLKDGAISDEQLLAEVESNPLQCGYCTTVWTVPLLRTHLRKRYGCEWSDSTLRRRLHAVRLRWKRPRYVFAQKDPNRAQKKGALSAGYGRCRPRAFS
jgi:transposase